MKTTFDITSTGALVSSTTDDDAGHKLRIGARIELRQDYVTPWGVVPKGSAGFIELVDDYDGTAWLLMEGAEPALYHWDNRLVLSPYSCEDLLPCLRLSVDNRQPTAHQLAIEERMRNEYH